MPAYLRAPVEAPSRDTVASAAAITSEAEHIVGAATTASDSTPPAGTTAFSKGISFTSSGGRASITSGAMTSSDAERLKTTWRMSCVPMEQASRLRPIVSWIAVYHPSIHISQISKLALNQTHAVCRTDLCIDKCFKGARCELRPSNQMENADAGVGANSYCLNTATLIL